MRYQRLINTCLFCIMATIAMAQTSSNSPYTRYGFGELSDQHFGNSKAMGGIAYGLRNGLQVNAANPASYTAIDSLTFIFDAGLSLQNTNFKENGKSLNAKNSSVDYIAMQMIPMAVTTISSSISDSSFMTKLSVPPFQT